jgi:hypothetical protein
MQEVETRAKYRRKRPKKMQEVVNKENAGGRDQRECRR